MLNLDLYIIKYVSNFFVTNSRNCIFFLKYSLNRDNIIWIAKYYSKQKWSANNVNSVAVSNITLIYHLPRWGLFRQQTSFWHLPICKKQNELFLPSAQRALIYPSLQPLEHSPLTLSQGSLFIQWPLQGSVQLIPKYPDGHSMQRMMSLDRHSYNKI